MSNNPQAELSRTLALLAGAATSLAVALPAPGDTIARVIATGLGVVGLMLREGATVDEAIAAIRRVKHIDTRADDAAVDAKNAAKPSGIGTADTLPAPRSELRPVMVAVPVEAPSGTWGPPGEGD